ncbi:DUF4381 family protein [Pseudactinotalea sp. HY160]|uniref:DUF4381 family protein n=1 Tax=Pseudactinotalea sp. HY160 TaxID=2654490 RepID=UPI00128BF941|nr:DUF4381 family protein [Pseudactinotalea sp. HY160]
MSITDLPARLAALIDLVNPVDSAGPSVPPPALGEAPAGASAVVHTLAVDIHEPVIPASYSTWVWVVGLALVVAVAAWYGWVLWWTRRRPAPDPHADPAQWTSLRATTLARVDEAEQRFRDGESDLRGLALGLNRIMREFSTARLGQDTTSLTVSEIADLDGTDRLAGLLRGYEEPAFAFDSDAEALTATGRAREVIAAW